MLSAQTQPREPNPASHAVNHDTECEPTWRLDGMRANEAATGRPWTGTIRLEQPDRGITFENPSLLPTTTRLLGLDLAAGPKPSRGRGPIEPVEAWVRGIDLVAIYEPADARAVRATAMWRHWNTVDRRIAAWELIVSAQTSLPESDAAMAVVSSLPATGMLTADLDGNAVCWRIRGEATVDDGSCGVLLRCTGGLTALAAVHPRDRRRICAGRRGESEVDVECWLFSSLVEKGVLLRGRTLAAIGPTDGDTDWATEIMRAFNASPPVLTA